MAYGRQLPWVQLTTIRVVRCPAEPGPRTMLALDGARYRSAALIASIAPLPGQS
jgi:hypothetical protein